MEELINEYRTFLGAYYGIMTMDNYPLQVYILKDINTYMNNFINEHKLNIDQNYENKRMDNISLETKLLDAINVINKLDEPLELLLLVKEKLKLVKSDNNLG